MENQEAPKAAGSGLAVKIAIVFVLIIAVAGAVVLKKGRGPDVKQSAPDRIVQSSANAELPATDAPKAPRPRMAEFGSDKCIPCKAMVPVLDALRKDYGAAMEVTFTDVVKVPEAGYQNKINIIPCQVFYDPAGKELYRHEGFFAKEDILAKWKELGYEMKAGNH